MVCELYLHKAIILKKFSDVSARSLQTHTNLLSPPFPSLLPPQQQKNNYPRVTLDSKSTISSPCFRPELSSLTHSVYKTSICWNSLDTPTVTNMSPSQKEEMTAVRFDF